MPSPHDLALERLRIARMGLDLMYQWAGRGAQPGVRADIAQWRKRPLSRRRKTVLLWWLLGPDGTPPYKMSKPDSGYLEDAPGPKTCANCMSIYLHVENWVEVVPTEGGGPRLMPKGTFICDQVRGVIRPQDTCTELWSPQRSSAYFRRYQDPEKLENARRDSGS